MNECLPQPEASQRSTPVQEQVAFAEHVDAFARAFLDDPDLMHLSSAARRILAVSATLFLEHGAAATSVRDITRACGLTPGALYNHFASRDDVLYELVRHGHARLERRVDTALAEVRAADPRGRFTAFVGAYVTGHLAQPELAQVVRREYLHLSPQRRAEIVQRRRAMRGGLARLLREGSVAGQFELIGGPNEATAAAVMVLDMCSRTSEWYDPHRAGPIDRLIARYVAGALRLAGATEG
jgi:TetR/AcrR family transcriptional regulator, cholesterol catabolism regulator